MVDQPKEESMKINVNLETTPILFTDNIMMSLTEDGVVLDVCQRLGTTNQVRVVARIGMSPSHAQKFANKLEELLLLQTGKSQTGTIKN